jgi:hypothetical protein
MSSRGIRTVIYPVSDLETAKAVYGILAVIRRAAKPHS